MASNSTIRVENFTAGIGVEAQLNYTDGAYHNIANVLADLKYIGVDLVRAASLNSAGNFGGQNDYGIAASAGVKFDLVVDGSRAITSTLSQIDAFEKAHPGSVASIEGPNEVDHSPINYNGLTGAAAAVSFQNAFYAAAEADPNQGGVSIYSFSLGSGANPTGGYNEVAIHPYAAGGSQPLATLLANLKYAPAGAAAVITETGYSTLPTWSSGVDQLTQEKLTLNTLFDAVKLGVQTTYLYELLDAYADPAGAVSGDHYGLFDLNNNPKLAAVGLHNLMSILSDSGSAAATFQTTNLSYTVSNMPANGSSLVFEKSGGAFDVVLWNEPQIWNSSTHAEIASGAVQETVKFGVNVGEVKVYDPTLGTAAINDLTNVSQITVGVSDHPLIIEVTGVGSAATGQVTTTGSAVVLPPPAPVTAAASSAVANLLSNALVASADGQTITASAQNTVISGGAHNNVTLQALAHTADTLIAGTGYDVLVGATSGADTFIFQSPASSPVSHPDLISYFTASKDTIDLSGLDPVSASGTTEHLSWVSQFDHHAGEATIAYNSKTNLTTVAVDTVGMGVADFSVLIHGNVTTAAHFIL